MFITGDPLSNSGKYCSWYQLYAARCSNNVPVVGDHQSL